MLDFFQGIVSDYNLNNIAAKLALTVVIAAERSPAASDPAFCI